MWKVTGRIQIPLSLPKESFLLLEFGGERKDLPLSFDMDNLEDALYFGLMITEAALL